MGNSISTNWGGVLITGLGVIGSSDVDWGLNPRFNSTSFSKGDGVWHLFGGLI